MLEYILSESLFLYQKEFAVVILYICHWFIMTNKHVIYEQWNT